MCGRFRRGVEVFPWFRVGLGRQETTTRWVGQRGPGTGGAPEEAVQTASKNRPRRRYTPEFKRDAVASVHSSGRTVAAVAREVGTSRETLRNWVRDEEADRGRAGGVLTATEKDELGRLRRQSREQQDTIEMLRKATAFFARDSDR